MRARQSTITQIQVSESLDSLREDWQKMMKTETYRSDFTITQAQEIIN